MLGITLDRRSRRPLTVQLAQSLRERIMGGGLARGMRLPSSRTLSEELGIARGVVVEAYEQLEAEGFLESRRGIGVFVSAAALPPRIGPPTAARLELRDGAGEHILRSGPRWDFTPGIPDLASFPRRTWSRSLADAAAFGSARDFAYGEVPGDRRLRAALSSYLFILRGLRVEPERLFLTAGTSAVLQSLALFFRGSRFFFEDPGLPFARSAFAAADAPLLPLDVDGEGARPPPEGFERRPTPDLAYLTPSHQFPSGALMSISRRLEFIRAAEEGGAVLIEDDYDAEFRFKGTPVPPIASIAADSTIYLGSFSKTLAPFLRVGWMVLPPRLVAPWRDFSRGLNIRGSAPVQRSLAFMLETGAYERHLASMRRLYRRRRDALVSALRGEFGEGIETGEGHTGFHLVATLVDGIIDREGLDAVKAAGIAVSSVGEFRFRPTAAERELVLGYGNIDEKDIPSGIARLATVLTDR